MRLCHFSAHLGLWRFEFTNTIPDDSQSLNLSAADLRRLKHLNTFHKFSDDFCIQLLYVRVLTHKRNKAVYTYAVLLLGCNAARRCPSVRTAPARSWLSFPYSSLPPFLFDFGRKNTTLERSSRISIGGHLSTMFVLPFVTICRTAL